MNYIFDPTWFQKHQKGLLWLLNTPVIKVWFRWVLRIRKYDCKLSERIVSLEPNNYKVYLGLFLTEKGLEHKYRADFRTHNKFSKRLYYAFYPLWALFHTWDMLVANPFAPQLNLGFDTLTVYPDAHPETSTVDGEVNRTNTGGESWSTLRAGAGTHAYPSGDYLNIIINAHSTSNNFIQLSRFISLFDTSSLTSGATISSAVLSIYVSYKVDSLSCTPNIDVYTSNPASNTDLVTSDFANVGSTSQTGSPLAYSSITTSAYNELTLDSTGRGNINKTGISKFGIRNANYDVSGTTPSWVSSVYSLIQFRGVETSGTSNDPKLVVTYTTTIDYTLTCAYGSYTLTGQATTFTKALKMILAQGSYTLTGFATLFSNGYTLIAEYGSYALTGVATNLTKALNMTMAYGSYTLTGVATVFTKALKLTASTGYYTLTGFIMYILGWFKRIKPSRGTYTKRTKPSAGTWTKRTKPLV